MCGLLDYICRKYFEGRVDQIKEYTIAVEHFRRSEEFQSKRDPIVHVDANRLRQRLRRYYRGEGKDHPVYISIPSGQYAPVFHHRAAGDSLPLEDDQLDEPIDELPDEELEALSAAETVGASRGLDQAPHSIRLRSTRVLVITAAVILVSAALSIWLSSRTRTGASATVPRTLATTVPAAGGVSVLPPGPEIRILPGSSAERSVDERGNIWHADRFYSGGNTYEPMPTARLRAQDSVFCRAARVGTFGYDVPLKPGVYELRLYFAELRYGVEPEDGGEATRRFDVKANGELLLSDFDIVSDIGEAGALDVKVFKDIRPANDGFLHLSFEPRANEALLTGLEIVPGIPGKMRPVRITSRNTSYISSDKVLWEPDFFYRGGRQVSRIYSVSGTLDSVIYQNERFGHFSYRIPVVPGRYTVTLKFAETYFGQKNFRESAVGLRLFNVHCNGLMLLKNFDIAQEAGGEGRALDQPFHGIESDPQDKIVLTFVPVRNYACVNAIEVVQE